MHHAVAVDVSSSMNGRIRERKMTKNISTNFMSAAPAEKDKTLLIAAFFITFAISSLGRPYFEEGTAKKRLQRDPNIAFSGVHTCSGPIYKQIQTFFCLT
jgi:hypothetical protein